MLTNIYSLVFSYVYPRLLVIAYVYPCLLVFT